MPLLQTARLDLVPLSVELVECAFSGDRPRAEGLLGARFPEAWPGRALVERAFACSLERLHADPASALWGGHVMVVRAGAHEDIRRVVGSVIFGGPPDPSGTVEVAYGVDGSSQGKGFATEGTRAVVEWALTQPFVVRVTAATQCWHQSSLRVIEKLGMRQFGARPHDVFGELLLFERCREALRTSEAQRVARNV